MVRQTHGIANLYKGTKVRSFAPSKVCKKSELGLSLHAQLINGSLLLKTRSRPTRLSQSFQLVNLVHTSSS